MGLSETTVNQNKMKTKLLRMTLIGLTVLAFSCGEKDFDLHNPNVEQFVELLKNGNYANEVGHDLPAFSMRDVANLLAHVKDTTIIKGYPANPISSKMTHPKILSECIMWTIDGIRFGSKFPSLEPSLIDTANFSLLRLTNKQLVELSEVYMSWHNEYKANPTDAARKKNLFLNKTYKWN
jgi:predicted nucleotidyltransferase